MKIILDNIAVPDSIAPGGNSERHSRHIRNVGRLDHDVSHNAVADEFIKEGDWVVDAGAYIGTHTVHYLERVGHEGRVLAFEVNPLSFECLSHNCPHSILYNMGLSDEAREIGLHFKGNPAATYCASLRKTQIKSCLRTLDSFNLLRLDFYKIDVEGYELKVLNGSRETIERCKPVILLEINPKSLQRYGVVPKDLTDFLELFGYTCEELFGAGARKSWDLICKVK